MKSIVFGAVLAAAILFSGAASAENPSYIIWADLWYWPTYDAGSASGNPKGPGADGVAKHRRAAAKPEPKTGSTAH
ncbi:hypothetical protein MRS76_09455 [Rhizobiaceae bacterium n13]|uniref:Uncharacterized protein n=1 Tax=Ferirhizobium litorale TaxID=2927786 RepID=A0AAE3U2B5_9HYPH|nr:hypothetical protein [Fererhizobium litorale]MDI7862184.1 hypothetical protein [Fererhizobium litorale]MDI7922542.1 hypothetical protein [Fererhizobium litorale]